MYFYTLNALNEETFVENMNLLREVGVDFIYTSEPNFKHTSEKFNYGRLEAYEGFRYAYLVNTTNSKKSPINFEMALQNSEFKHVTFDIEPKSSFDGPVDEESEKLIHDGNLWIRKAAESGRSVSAYINPRQVPGVDKSRNKIYNYGETLNILKEFNGEVIIPAYPGPNDSIVNINHAASLAKLCNELGVRCRFVISGSDYTKEECGSDHIKEEKDLEAFTTRLNDLSDKMDKFNLLMVKPVIYKMGGGPTRQYKAAYVKATKAFILKNAALWI